MGVVDAVERGLADLRVRDAALADSGFAATALALAAEIDDVGTSATAKAACARSLFEVLERLRDLAPADVRRDGVDELASRRADRRAG